MKKLFVTLISILMICTVVGCAKNEEPKEEEVITDDVAGGWTIYDGDLNAKLPDEVIEAFELATQDMLGAKYEPIALLATQVVSGKNYAILCRETLVTANQEVKYAVVTVYKDLQGGAKVIKVEDVDLTAEASDEVEEDKNLLGGWKTYEENEACTIPEEALEAFNKAVDGMTGAGYEPIALLASQVVAGVNYKILCKQTLVTAEPVVKNVIVTVYADLNGGASITSIVPINDAIVEE